MKQLTKAKQKTLKMVKMYDRKYNEYKHYKTEHQSNLQEMELKEK